MSAFVKMRCLLLTEYSDLAIWISVFARIHPETLMKNVRYLERMMAEQPPIKILIEIPNRRRSN